jgi:steroid delta-isomerase-like uncharacterized protein
MAAEANKALIRRYYADLWNAWNLDLARELVAPDISFRGSLGVAVTGLEGFTRYMEVVRRAFPDYHNHIEELIAEGDRVAARLTYSGTQLGEVFGIPPTGKRVTYAGVAIFRVVNGKIAHGWVVGDVDSLKRQLSAEATA